MTSASVGADAGPTRAVQHPLHAEAVGELAVEIAPGLHAERRGGSAALGQTAKQRLSLCAVVHHQNMRRTAHRLGVVVVRGVEQHAGPFESGMHDLAAHRLVAQHRHVFAMTLHVDNVAQAALRVKFQRLLAVGGEEQIVGQPHHCFSCANSTR
jgi:hypothetical protein